MSLPVTPSTLEVELVKLHAAELVERGGWTRKRLLAYQQVELKKALRHALDA
jgi:hypothetical protein